MAEEEKRVPLPDGFLARMQTVLGEDFPKFLSAMNGAPSRGLRVNTTSQPKEKFESVSGFPLRQIPYSDSGFYLDTEEKLGNHPLHHAGAFYLQEPSAMLPIAAGGIKPGDRVLDLCASPGGKTFQIASLIGETGLLFSNEIDAGRCATLAGNVERLGLRRVVVTNADAAVFGQNMPGFFDLLAVDAPCSGEGMFRKTPEAVGEWSPSSPGFSAERQKEILSDVLPALKPGGKLIYSTCTYSPEENEEVVSWLLTTYPDLSLLPIPEAVVSATAPGLARPLVPAGATRRHYPQTGEGEGQFLALLAKSPDAVVPARAERAGKRDRRNEKAAPSGKGDGKAIQEFLHEVLTDLPECDPVTVGEDVYLPPIPIGSYGLPERAVFVPGVRVGRLQKGRIVPHHSFFKCYADRFRIRLDYPADSPEAAAYLHGDTFPCPGVPDGWGVILCEGYPLGGVKITGAVAKNHYPKGLRR